MDYIGGVDEMMSWMLKTAYAACIIVVGFMLLSRLIVVVKVVNSRGLVIKRAGCMKLIASGKEVECPYWVIDKASLQKHIANLHAFQIGTNSTSFVVHVSEHGSLYWFDGGKIGVTHCRPVFDWNARILLRRWLFLSDVALNQTYDVLDCMKGLKNASVVCRETGSGVGYTLKYLNRKYPREIIVDINESKLTK